MQRRYATLALLGFLCLSQARAMGQPLGRPDRDKPGDRMIQESLANRALALDARFDDDLKSAEQWTANRPGRQREFLRMLGLDPLPERTPLKAVVTGTYNGDGFTVENLHYQSKPGLHVTGNLYRPANAKPWEKFPAIFYVCGHSGMGRDGNKTAFMPHGMWFARHGYVCLIVDTLQLGEIPATHHGTYNLNRWWWHSRGYTSAGVECWNGVRGIDYLASRPDVDPERIGVTGISGGGAATFWIAAADDRVKVAVPVSGMADLESYVGNRVVNGHCDCMFLHNAAQWPWTRIAGLIAPRPLLFVNSDQDAIFPMDANQRVIARLERLYSLFGAGDRVDAVVSVGGHAYRRDIRAAVYRFFNIHFKNDPRPVEDADVDAVPEAAGRKAAWPIDPTKLRVFKTDADLPADALNARIDESFVPTARPVDPKPLDREKLRTALNAAAEATFPLKVAPAERSGRGEGIKTDPGIEISLRRISPAVDAPGRVVMIVADSAETSAADFKDAIGPRDLVYLLHPRGIGATEWTVRNPPNYVARSLALLGRTVDSERLHDVRRAAALLATTHPNAAGITVAGRRGAGVLGAYAALFDDTIGEVIALDAPATHMDPTAPALLNVMRVLDIPDVFAAIGDKKVSTTTKKPH